MPRGDGTGPMGRGQMAGRGLGRGAGSAFGFGLGRGRGRNLGSGLGSGLGLAWRRGQRWLPDAAAQAPQEEVEAQVPEDEAESLRLRVNALERELAAIRQRLVSLDTSTD